MHKNEKKKDVKNEEGILNEDRTYRYEALGLRKRKPVSYTDVPSDGQDDTQPLNTKFKSKRFSCNADGCVLCMQYN